MEGRPGIGRLPPKGRGMGLALGGGKGPSSVRQGPLTHRLGLLETEGAPLLEGCPWPVGVDSAGSGNSTGRP